MELTRETPMGRVLLDSIERGTVLWDEDEAFGELTVLDFHLRLREIEVADR